MLNSDWSFYEKLLHVYVNALVLTQGFGRHSTQTDLKKKNSRYGEIVVEEMFV